jgi:hypothetical protein
MAEMRRVLVTGATGKVGQNFIASLLANPKFAEFKVRALCHHRSLPGTERLEVIRGSIEHREVAGAALADVSHVVHLATSKETPDSAMDVAIKGMFWLLEACRSSATFERFVLVGDDAAIRRLGSKLSTFVWMNRWTMLTWQPIYTGHGAFRAWRCQRRITRLGSTTPRPSSFSVGDLALISSDWRTRPSTTCVPKATPERSGTRVERHGSSGATRQ